jgi:hypothetical protein
MTSWHFADSKPGRWLRPARLLIAVVLGAAAATCVAAAAATSGPLVSPGAGTWVANHSAFVGYYRARVAGRWVKVYCVSPDRRAPSRVSLSTLSRVPATSVTVTRELAETLSAHGDAATAGQAEAVSQALNYEIGNRAAVQRRARDLAPAVQARAMAYLAEARRWRASSVLRVHAATSALPGQSGTGTISLSGPGGGRAGRVRLTHSANVSTPASVRTDAAGRASFTYRTVGVGAVRIAATATGLAPAALRSSHPGSTTQRMLSWAPSAGARAMTTYRGRVAGLAESYDCSSTCDGHPLATLTACAPASHFPSRITYEYGPATHSVDFPASASRSCRKWTATLADGDHVTAAWRFHGPHGWTGPVAAGGSFVVDCPPAPPVAVSLSFDCRSATLSVALGRQPGGVLAALRNSSSHRMVLLLSGALTGRFVLEPGGTATAHTFELTCGAHATVIVRGGVQRRGGAWNYGLPAQVVLP